MSKPRKEEVSLTELDFWGLVEIVKKRGKADKKKIDLAYNEIEFRMKVKLKYITSQFFIPGCTQDDIYQEALFALRFEAIPKYDKERETRSGEPYPFDKFAMLIIRRRLSSLLKSCFQHKKKTLNTSVSLDQYRNGDDNQDDVCLADIVPAVDGNVLDILNKKENKKQLFGKLFDKLSKFERKIYLLYIQRYSYAEMTRIINKEYKDKNRKKKIRTKSVDNSLSRIKQKLLEIFQKLDEDELKDD